MNSVALKTEKDKRYLPHEVTTKVYSVKSYRQTKDIDLGMPIPAPRPSSTAELSRDREPLKKQKLELPPFPDIIPTFLAK